MRRNRPPHLLYKYYGAERVDVARSLQVRFSQPAALNDPFEFALDIPPGSAASALKEVGRRLTTPWAFIGLAIAAAWRSKDDERVKTLPIAARFIFVSLIVLFAPIIAIAIYPFARRWLFRAMEMAGQGFEDVLTSKGFGAFLIFSCSECWNSVPMWAHYAGNHTGFVIGFDPDTAFTAVTTKGVARPVRARAVRYVSKRPRLRLDSAGTDDIFGSKFKDWRYEREWRFTQLAENAQRRGTYSLGHEILLFDIRSDAILEVVFGLNASNETVEAVCSAFSEAGCTPSFSRISQGQGYEFTRVQSLDAPYVTDANPVPSLTDMFVEPAYDLFHDFKNDARKHRIMRRFVD